MGSQVKDLMGNVRWAWSLTCLVCVCFCFFQIYQLLGEFSNPTKTHTFVEETQLQNIPINIRICVTPAFDEKALQELGYDSPAKYIAGESKFNNTMDMVGWGGHTSQSSALMKSAQQVLDTVRINGIDYLKHVDGLTHEANGFRYNLTQLNLTNENVMSDCYILTMKRIEQLKGTNRKLTGKRIMWIGIQFDGAIEKNNFSVVIQLQGETLASHRHINRHKFYHSGDTIDDFSSDYIVEIKKRVIAEDDPSNTCRNYPNKDFLTYKDCDDKFIAETLKDITDGLSVTPPWITDNLNDVTVTPVPWLYTSWQKYSKEGNIIIHNPHCTF